MQTQLHSRYYHTPHSDLARALKNEGTRATMPPGWVLDEIAEQSMSGGYDTSQSNICPRCRITKFANGSCYC